MRAALLAATLLLGIPTLPHAQPAPAAGTAKESEKDGDAHALARQFLDKIGAEGMMGQLLGSTRAMVVTMFQQQGKTEQQAGEIFDSFLLPTFKKRMPDLIQRFEDILVADFTVPELRAIVNNEQNDARRSAAAKAGQLQSQFGQAGQQWGQQAGTEAYNENKATLQKLGLDVPGGSAK